MTMSQTSTRTVLTAKGKDSTPVHDRPEALMKRVRAEYREMPGLCLTVQQASRLWQIDATTCARMLDVLVAERFLKRTPAGAFISAGSARQNIRFD